MRKGETRFSESMLDTLREDEALERKKVDGKIRKKSEKKKAKKEKDIVKFNIDDFNTKEELDNAMADIDLQVQKSSPKKDIKFLVRRANEIEKKLALLETNKVKDMHAVDSVPVNETIIQNTSDNVVLEDTGNIGNNSENLDKKTSGVQALENLSGEELKNKFIELIEIGRKRGARIRELATSGDPENVRPGLIAEQEEGYQEYLKYKERLEESTDIRKAAESKTQEPTEKLQETREKLKKKYEEIKSENPLDDKDVKIAELEAENDLLKEAVKTEQLKTAEARLAKLGPVLDNLEKILQEKINALPEKEAGKLDKIWKFVNKKEVKFAIGVGLITGAAIATSGGALVGAWLHLPYGLGIAGLGGTSNLTTALLGSAFSSSAYSSKLKEGFQENMKELLDVARNEQQAVNELPVKKEGFFGKLKNKIFGGKQEKNQKEEGVKEFTEKPVESDELILDEKIDTRNWVKEHEIEYEGEKGSKKKNKIEVRERKPSSLPAVMAMEAEEAKKKEINKEIMKIQAIAIDNFIKDFKTKKLIGADLFRFSKQIAKWLRESENEEIIDNIAKKFSKIFTNDDNFEIRGKLTNEMVKYAKETESYKNKNKKEILELIGNLTFKDEKDAVLEIEGINEETKKWLEGKETAGEKEIEKNKERFSKVYDLGSSPEDFENIKLLLGKSGEGKYIKAVDTLIKVIGKDYKLETKTILGVLNIEKIDKEKKYIKINLINGNGDKKKVIELSILESEKLINIDIKE